MPNIICFTLQDLHTPQTLVVWKSFFINWKLLLGSKLTCQRSPLYLVQVVCPITFEVDNQRYTQELSYNTDRQRGSMAVIKKGLGRHNEWSCARCRPSQIEGIYPFRVNQRVVIPSHFYRTLLNQMSFRRWWSKTSKVIYQTTIPITRETYCPRKTRNCIQNWIRGNV